MIAVEGVMVVEGEMTGDGRYFEKGSVRWDAGVLPLPLIWDRENGDHTGATIGLIDSVERRGNSIWGRGVLSDSDDPETRAAVARVAELLSEGAVGVSIAADSIRGHARIDNSVFDEIEEDEDGIKIPIAYDMVTLGYSEARLRHLAIVDTPAFASAALNAVPLTGALVASAGILHLGYFDNPNFGTPGDDPRLRYDPDYQSWSCPVTVEGDHIFGHVAPMGVCLRGRPASCITPPDGDLEGFMRGYAPAAGGKRTGVVVVGGSHADVGVGVIEASKHYDKTGRAGADVRVGRDAYGIWFSGMIRPGLSKEDRYALAASDVSGHWEIGKRGVPVLVGLPAVNVGGFPKGYLTADEVSRGVAASLSLEEPCDDLTLADIIERVKERV
jgi:hypothetical protein